MNDLLQGLETTPNSTIDIKVWHDPYKHILLNGEEWTRYYRRKTKDGYLLSYYKSESGKKIRCVQTID